MGVIQLNLTYSLFIKLVQKLWFTHQVFEGLHSQGQQTEVRDWVLLSLGSFIQQYVIVFYCFLLADVQPPALLKRSRGGPSADFSFRRVGGLTQVTFRCVLM